MHTYSNTVIPEEFYIGKQMSDFSFIKIIGEGAHGIVYKVQSNINGEIYALKKIKLKHMKQIKISEALIEV